MGEAVQPVNPRDAGQLLTTATGRDAARPLFTFYDDSTGERVELSGATTANWVAKTANLFVDGLALPPGATVALLLPLHWQTAVLTLAAWSVGAVVVPLDPASSSLDSAPAQAADVVVAGPDQLEAALDLAAGEVLGLSLRPLGATLPHPVPGVWDYAVEVPAYGDHFAASVDPAAPALISAGRTVTGAEVAAEAVAAAERWGLDGKQRVLTTLGYDDSLGLLAGLTAPLAGGASVVLCRRLDPATLGRRLTTERVTATVGVEAAGLRRLSA